MISGILILKKPSGPSSSGVLGPVKRALKTKKVGHSGTLDPFASGVMIVLAGTATRTARWFTALDKQYRGIVQFGSETDTLDREGSIVKEAPLPDADTVLAVLPGFCGEIQQTPPVYSALKIQGRRAYQIARAGGAPEMSSRNVRIHAISMQPLMPAEGIWELSVTCGSGTYVRALARDIATAAGTVGHLQELERLSVGPFTLESAVSLERLQEETEPQTLLRPAGPALRELQTFGEIELNRDQLRAVQSGRPLDDVLSPLEEDGMKDVLALSPAGEVVAVLRWTAGRWRYELVLKPLEHSDDADQ